MEVILLLIFLSIFLSIYYIPFIISKVRNIKNKNSVFWLNTFFGWSGIGWIILIFYSSLINKSDTMSVTDYVKKHSKKKLKK
jgi:hypothetical protein